MIGYWFAASDTLPNGDGRKVVIGETLRVEPPIALYERGLHASEHPFDALQYAPGSLLYRVELSGEILRDSNRCCATERTALAVIDATDALRTFARQQALSVIHLWAAPEVVHKYLETGDENLRAAAQAVAWYAAWAAAWDTANAPARDAAWYATSGTAAWAAAWYAAGCAARVAARATARAAFKQMIEAAFLEAGP